jgi:hypothetical protein
VATCIDIIDSRSFAHPSAVQVALQTEKNFTYPSLLTGGSSDNNININNFYQNQQQIYQSQQQQQQQQSYHQNLQQSQQQQQVLSHNDYYSSYGNPQLQQQPPLNNNHYHIGNSNKGKAVKKGPASQTQNLNNFNNTNTRRMGRKKIQITRIQDERNRQVCHFCELLPKGTFFDNYNLDSYLSFCMFVRFKSFKRLKNMALVTLVVKVFSFN